VPNLWLQVALRGSAENIDAIADFLIERGSPGVAIKKNEVRGYFSEPFDVGAIRGAACKFLDALESYDKPRVRADVAWRIIKEEDWNKRWRRFIKPQKIGKAFWVTPPWIAPPKLRNRHVITIEPGMAFGTGSHATTRGCLEFIERVANRLRKTQWTGLDVGTGSGILSIAMVQLGAARVWGIDNDPVALEVARENLVKNAVAKSVRLSAMPLNRLRKTFPLVVANLTADTIIDLSAALGARVAKHGALILSGILNSRAERVLDCMTAAGYILIERKREGQWTTLLLRRQA